MTDRFDPKPSAKPTGGRSGPAGGVEDPLAELARIVSGKSPFDPQPPKPERPAPFGGNSQHPPLPSEAELARDLEAELLNELQASFSTIPEIVGRPAQAPAPAAPQPQPAPPPVSFQPVPPPVSFQPQPTPPSAPQAKAPAPQSAPPIAEPMDVLEELGIPADMLFRPPPAPDSDLPRAPQMVPLPPLGQPRAEQPRIPQPPPPAAPQAPPKRESLATRIARATQGDRSEAAPPVRAEQPRMPQPPARQPVRQPQNQNPNPRVEPASSQFRPTLAPNGPQAENFEGPRAASTRWDPPAEQRLPDLSRFAPPKNDAPASEPGPKRPPPAEQDFVEEFPFATADAAEFDEPSAQAADMIPGYDDDDQVPYPDDDYAYERKRSPFQSPFLIAAVLGIVAIGGAAAIVFRPDSAPDTPPIIAADTSPTKVAPDNTASGEGESQAKMIYDRVDPGSEVAGSQLSVPDQDPIADIPPIPGASAGDSAVSRVILGGGPGFDGPDDANAPTESGDGGASAQEPESIGPKKVRTVVVRPDGTIVSSAASDDGNAPALPEIPPASETPPAPAADENPLLAEEFGGETETAAAPPPSAPAAEQAPAPPASESIPDIPAPRAAAPETPPAAPRVQAPPPPTVVATTNPVDMTPAGGATRPQGGAGGGFLVQVSSQRTEETALSTFRELQRRYPSILGDRAADIQRADLGERGVYFRVRVGYPTRETAIEMCESLKAAGGDCILATR
jgi:hypothetical protein